MRFTSPTRKKFKKIFLIVGWLVTWLSIGVTPDYLINFEFSLSLNLLNFFRGIFPIIYLIPMILFFFFEIKNKISLAKNPIIILLTLYFTIQIIAVIINKAEYTNDIYYLILATNTLLIISVKFYQKERDNFFIYISITFIFLLFLNFCIPQVKNFLHTPLSFYQQWGIATDKKTFLNNFNVDYIYPNILGFSRYVLILLLFIYFFNARYNLILNIIIVILASLLFLLQARATLFTYLIFVFLHPFLFKKIKVIQYLKKIFLLLFIPLIIFFSLNLLKVNFFFKKYVEIRNEAEKKILEEKGLFILRPGNKGNFTSDRFVDWREMIEGNKKEFLGLGPQADRNYYKKTASNGLIYAFVCAGYFGLLFFLILCIYSFYISIKNLLIWRNLPSNFNNLFYPIICLVFLIRSIFETSFAVFGIDYILFFYCLFTIQKFIKN
jgi:hypothetical protein